MIKMVCKLLLILFVFFSFLPNSMAADQTLGDLKKIWKDFEAQKIANENKTDQAKEEIAKREAAIKKAEADIYQAQYEQTEAQQKIEESNQNIETLKLESEKVLQYMQQMQNSNAYVEYVTGASSMTELVTRIEAVKQITDYIQTTINRLQNEIKKNEDLKVELEKKQKTLDAQIISYQNTIKTYYKNIEEYNKFDQDIDSKIKTAKENYETNKKICQTNIGKSDDSVKISQCTKYPYNSGWLRPLKSGVVTSPVGSRWGSYHNALDLGVVEGTPVYPAAAGTVIATYYRQKCGGNEVFIYSIVNGVGYTHYYYHLLNYNVKVGDVVDQNTVIATSGGGRQTMTYDTCTFGAHLHYGVARGYITSHTKNKNIVLAPPPGFQNREGYRWYNRYI